MPQPAPRQPPSRIRIEHVAPVVDGGRFPVKRTVGDRVVVSADVVRDGHEILGGCVRYRGPEARRSTSAPLEPLGNDRFAGSFEAAACGRWQFAVEAWYDRAASWRDELQRKVAAGQQDLSSELAEGEQLLGISPLDLETALASAASDREERTRSGSYKL
ncbi:MAG TPA: maltotransferase domain-containing protein, partial [Gaiellaceae bacterium]|nr:maltotransferase domain-containing protein [Gaiellaceae bacterium]